MLLSSPVGTSLAATVRRMAVVLVRDRLHYTEDVEDEVLWIRMRQKPIKKILVYYYSLHLPPTWHLDAGVHDNYSGDHIVVLL